MSESKSLSGCNGLTLKKIWESWNENRWRLEVSVMRLVLVLTKEVTFVDKGLAVLGHGH